MQWLNTPWILWRIWECVVFVPTVSTVTSESRLQASQWAPHLQLVVGEWSYWRWYTWLHPSCVSEQVGWTSKVGEMGDHVICLCWLFTSAIIRTSTYLISFTSSGVLVDANKKTSVELKRELRLPTSVNYKALTCDAISSFVYSERHLLFAFLSRLSLIFMEFTTWKTLYSTTAQSQWN